MRAIPGIDEMRDTTEDEIIAMCLLRGRKLIDIGQVLLDAHGGSQSEKAGAFDKIVAVLWPKTKGIAALPDSSGRRG